MRTIAEIGTNYDDLDDLINYCHRLDADIIKLQSYTASDLYENPQGKDCCIPIPWMSTIREACRNKHKGLMISLFNYREVELYAPYVDYLKVASSEITYIPLLEEMAKTKKPVFVSTGGASFDQIQRAVEIIGKEHIILMHCEVEYPCHHGFPWFALELAKKFETQVGYSDHTTQIHMSKKICEDIGLNYWEKHVRFDRFKDKPDSAVAITVSEFNSQEVRLRFNPYQRVLRDGKWVRPM